jgi:5-methylcytosine-specific restriction endonuclease McrA
MRPCNKCGTVLPPSGYYKERATCKECVKAKERERYATEEYKKYSRERRRRERSDPELKARDRDNLREWRKANPERYKAQYTRNNSARYWADPQRAKDKGRAWRKANPEKHTAQVLKYTHRKRANGGPGVSLAEWKAIQENHKNACYYCGTTSQKLTRDHLVPLSKGGVDAPSNVVPACRPCNSRKHTMMPFDYIRKRQPAWADVLPSLQKDSLF